MTPYSFAPYSPIGNLPPRSLDILLYMVYSYVLTLSAPHMKKILPVASLSFLLFCSTFTAAYAADTIPPQVLMSPVVNTTATGTIMLAAFGADETAIASIQLKLNGGTNFGPPVTAVGTSVYTSTTLNTVQLTNGTHSVSATVRDLAGNEAVVARSLTVTNVFNAPVATPLAGTYTSAQNVTLLATGALSIRYTANGANPTCTTGTIYSSALSVSTTTTIRAVACYSANVSAVSTFSYTINITPPAPTPLPPVTISDYFIQDVCLSSTGAVLPLDPRSSSCASTRNLMYGESLPYSKHDQPGIFAAGSPQGFWASDSFPIRADLLITAASTDHGVDGDTFSVFDTAHDGFSSFELLGTYASITGTRDPIGGVQYFIAPTCRTGTGNTDAWGLFPATTTVSAGSKLFPLKIAATKTACPTTFDTSYTVWTNNTTNHTYKNGAVLPTIVTSHYSHATIPASDHIEKLYFTKVYGQTKWERWEKAGTVYHTNEATRAATFASWDVCAGPSSFIEQGVTWYLVDCHDYTNIVPATGTSSAWMKPLTWWNWTTVLP